MHGWALFPHGESRRYHEGLLFTFRNQATFPNEKKKLITSVKLLMRNVQKPRNPCMTNPDMMHLISGIPEPAAYLANDRTRRDATKENMAFP